MILELGEDLRDGFNVFVRKALPLTAVVAVVFLLSFQHIRAEYALNEAVSKVVFVGLAALTFPHIVLEYLFERYGSGSGGFADSKASFGHSPGPRSIAAIGRRSLS